MISLKPGDIAPDFEAVSTVHKNTKLSDFRGKNVVLYFYPKDMTPGCTTEACDFRDTHIDFENANTVILGISKDSIKRHHSFTEKHGLPFILISDEGNSICETYGVWQEKKIYGKTYMGIVRTTFIIDKEGIIQKVFEKVKVKDHVQNALQFIKEHLE